MLNIRFMPVGSFRLFLYFPSLYSTLLTSFPTVSPVWYFFHSIVVPSFVPQSGTTLPHPLLLWFPFPPIQSVPHCSLNPVWIPSILSNFSSACIYLTRAILLKNIGRIQFKMGELAAFTEFARSELNGFDSEYSSLTTHF